MISAMTLQSENPGKVFLGIEGGGTRTVALLADGNGQSLGRLEAGPANMKLLTEAQLIRHFRSIANAWLSGRAWDWAFGRLGGSGLQAHQVCRRESVARRAVLRDERPGDGPHGCGRRREGDNARRS